MFNRIGIETYFIAAVTALAMPQLALAESGTYEAVYAFVTNYVSFEHNNGMVTSGSNRGTSTVIDSTGGLFVKGQSSAQECAILASKTSAGINLDSLCTATDASGDKLFQHGIRRAGEATQGSAPGTSEIVAGTGKYIGITGRCSYTVQFVPENRGVATLKCQWQKP
ncbi:MAG TPA: hypothetical protein VMH32_04320 [Burkholderiales bacterium]|nr:hypothetical protein [Burkholderiales bacterium]